MRRSRRYWFAFRILVIQSLTHSGVPTTNLNLLCKLLAARAETFWIFAKVKCTSSPGLITRWTLSTHNFCPSGFARTYRKLFLEFPSFCFLTCFQRQVTLMVSRFWLCKVMKHDVHNIKQSKDRLQIWWHTFQREKTIKIWALKTLGPLQPSSICKDVPHPRTSLDVLYDSLYSSQVIENGARS